MAQRRTRYDRLSETEEGWRHRDAQYGARLTNLASEFTKLDREDQEFLKILLSHGTSAEPGLRQGSRGERMDRVGPSDYSPLSRSVSDTPGGDVGSKMSDEFYTPRHAGARDFRYQTPRSVSFRDVEQSRLWSSTPGPVDSHRQRYDHVRHRDTAATKLGNPVGYGHGYSCPPAMTAPLPPKLDVFSGDGQKNEASYAQWRSEVQSILRAGIYEEPMIMTNVRRSLRGRAADALLTMGTEVRVQQVLDKFDVRFGDVCPTDMTLEQCFTARQLPTESMSAWGCRLEEIVSKIKDPDSAAAARTMLRTRYWTGIYSEKIRNALRHHFDDGADFESLLRQARIAEQEPTSMPLQQRAVVPSTDKLDEILRQLKELTCRVTELEKRCLYPSSSPAPSHPSQVVYSAAVPPVVTGPSAETERRQFQGRCYACGLLGHRRGSPLCASNQSGNGRPPEWTWGSTWSDLSVPIISVMMINQVISLQLTGILMVSLVLLVHHVKYLWKSKG